MATLFEFVLTAFVIALAVPAVLLALEIFLAMPASRSANRKIEPGNRPGAPLSVAILVPAHNEAKVIAPSLQSLRRQLRARDRLLVVADNCSDDTAAVAAQSGAEVIVRHDPERRGKGYALDFGVRHLEAAAPDIVIAVDADCHAHEGAIRTLAGQAAATGVPVQAQYLMLPHQRGSLGQRVSAFAFMVKNHVRPLGLKRLGAPSHLAGTGMAFPWDVIRTAQLATGNIVEDMQLGVDCVRNGTPAVYCPDAVVTSYFPLGAAALAAQRQRWEHGHMHTILFQAPKLVLDCLRSGSLKGLLFALDLAIPPLTLLLLLLLAGALAVATAAVATGIAHAQAAALAGLTVVAMGSLCAAWWRFGREVLPLRAALAIPAYAASKVSLYFGFRPGSPRYWVRTLRD